MAFPDLIRPALEVDLFSKTRALAIFWTLLTLSLHVIPRETILEMPGGEKFVGSTILDKFAHAFLFGVLGFLWTRGFRFRVGMIVFIGLAYGVFLEACQAWLISGRSGSVADLIADVLGLTIGATVAVKGFRTNGNVP